MKQNKELYNDKSILSESSHVCLLLASANWWSLSRNRSFTMHLSAWEQHDHTYLTTSARAENPKYDLKNQHLQLCTLQAPFCTRQQAQKARCQFMWLYLTYLLFDSHSLRVKSAQEIRFQVQTIPEVNQNLHNFKCFLNKSHKISSDVPNCLVSGSQIPRSTNPTN